MWRSTSAIDLPGLAQIEKGIDSLTPGSADSHQINISGFPVVRDNLEKGLFLKKVRENLEKSGIFVKSLKSQGKVR